MPKYIVSAKIKEEFNHYIDGTFSVRKYLATHIVKADCRESAEQLFNEEYRDEKYHIGDVRVFRELE